MFKLKKDKKIFIVTNRHLIQQGDIYKVIEKCALKGADGVILREKDLTYDSLKQMAKKIKNITDRDNIPLIINGNVDVAKDLSAYGFHTGIAGIKEMSLGNEFRSSYSEKESLKRRNIEFKLDECSSEKPVLGVSVHSVEEAIEAEELGANYLMAGHVFETECKQGLEGRGIEFIEKVCESVKIPVIAIGGICPVNLEEVLSTGVAGVAVMSYGMRIK